MSHDEDWDAPPPEEDEMHFPARAQDLGEIKDVWEIHAELTRAIEAQKWEQALEQVTSLIEIEPNVEYWVSKGFVLTKMKRFDESLGAYEEALLISPNNAKILYNAGYSLMMLDRFREAEGYLNRTLELEPGNEFAMDALKMCRKVVDREKWEKEY